jgi:hypothetical protein
MALELLTGGDATISRREWEYAKMMRRLCEDFLDTLEVVEQMDEEDFYEED